MSVEGVEGIFCVAGDPCIATFSTGACPATQEGLPYGSYCGVVASGVYGCKTYTSPQTEAPTPEPTTEAPTPEPTTAAPTPEPTTAAPATTEPATTQPPTTQPPTIAPIPISPFTNCSSESTQVSVQGLKGAYCVNEPVCVEKVSTGNCPALRTVCSLAPSATCSRPALTAAGRTRPTTSPPMSRTTRPWTARRTRQATPREHRQRRQGLLRVEPVCSGSIFGNCPQIQDGLTQNSECMVIDTGVYGCMFMAST